MKIAILYSGQPRYIEETIQNHLKFFRLQQHEYKIFAHFWYSSSFKDIRGLSYLDNNIDISNSYLKNILNTDNVLLEDDDLVFSKLKNRNSFNPALHMQFYSLNKLFNLYSEELKEYDILIRLRTDLFFKSSKFFNLDKLKENTLYLSNFIKFDEDSVSDYLAISDFQIMKKYCEFYENIENIFSIKRLSTPEILLGNYLKSLNIFQKYLPINVVLYRNLQNQKIKRKVINFLKLRIPRKLMLYYYKIFNKEMYWSEL